MSYWKTLSKVRNSSKFSKINRLMFLSCFVLAGSNIVADEIFDHSGRWCIAHRGYSSKFLENSLTAFHQAIKFGAHGIELDVQHTKDGVGIVLHDETIERTGKSRANQVCQLNKPVSDQLFSEIADRCILNNNEDILTLHELLVFMQSQDPSVRVFVELKDRPSRSTMQLLAQFSSRVTIIAMNKDHLLEVQDFIGPSLNIPYLLVSEYVVDFSDRLSGIGASHFTDEDLNDLKSRGKIIDVWTVNDQPKMKDFFSRGVHYVTTDEVERCVNLLRSF